MFTNLSDPVECKDLTKFGLTVGGCGWKGTTVDLIEEYHNSISPLHPLSGWEGYEYKCPQCLRILDTVIIKQS